MVTSLEYSQCSARSNNSTLTRAAVQDDFDWAAHYEEMEADEARETVPFSQNEANPPNGLAVDDAL